jgi:hypothetical protein
MMKKTVWRYGLYAGLAELVLFVAIWLLIYVTHISHEVQGNISWANLLLPLVFVYFGIRYYRDRVNNGYISFLGAVKLGLLIVIIPAVSFAIIESVYVLAINPNFYRDISLYDIEQYRKTLPPAQFALKVKEINEQVALDNNPLFNFVLMVLTVGALGVLATLASALLLFRRKVRKAVTA